MMTDISFRIVSNWFKNDYAQNCSRKFRWKKSIGKKPEPWEIDKKLSVGTEEKINKELCFPCQSSSQWLLSLSRQSQWNFDRFVCRFVKQGKMLLFPRWEMFSSSSWWKRKLCENLPNAAVFKWTIICVEFSANVARKLWTINKLASTQTDRFNEMTF